MSGTKSAYLEAQLLDLVLGTGTFVKPANVWFALSTAPFDATLTGTTITEPSGVANYARVEVTNDGTTWPDASAGTPALKSNGVDIPFATATGDWTTVYSVYVLDAATVGNVLYGADLITPAAIDTGSNLTITVGSFVLTET